MIELFKKKNYFGLLILFAALAILVWFFIIKIIIFKKLGYQSDLYTHLEISRGWLQGRPLMHENCYGYHAKLHNYFFTPLMGPLTLYLGAYGIFIIHFVLYVWALLYTFPVLYRHGETLNHKLVNAVFYLVIFLGPIGFWLYDNTHYGFHPELLYIPFGFIFSVSLYKKQLWVSILTGVLMISIREDGPVMVACLLLLHIALQWITGKITTRKWITQSMLWGGVCLLLFGAGMYYLKYKNDFGYDRLTESLERIALQDAPKIKNYFWGITQHFIMLLLPFILFVVYMRALNFKAALAFFVVLIPVIIVNFISGFIYFPSQYFSLTWPPRFSLTFAIILAFSANSILLFSRPWFRPAFINVMLAVVFGYFVFKWQVLLLQAERGYDWRYFVQDVPKQQYPQQYYPAWNDIYKVSQVLPPMYPVAPPERLFGFFHKHDLIWVNRIYMPWVRARMLIIDETNVHDILSPAGVLQHPDSVVTERVRYYFEAEDRHYLIKAGITGK